MNSNLSDMVIVGAGQAGGETAVELRKLGFKGSVLIVGEEPHVPYKRPPLSKACLAGSVGVSGLYVMPAASLQQAGIEFVGGRRVRRIDRAAHQLEFEDGGRSRAARGRIHPAQVAAVDGLMRQLGVPCNISEDPASC